MKHYFIFPMLFMALLGCQKKEAEPKSTLALLTNNSQKSWKLADGLIKLDEQSQLSILGTRPVCETDNLLILKSDKTYEVTEGATKCNLADPNVIISSANWSLSADEKVLEVDRFIFLNFEILNAKFNIIEINEEAFSGETEVEFQGQKYTGIVKFLAE